MGWPEGDESSVLRLVTGVVLLGGIGGEGLAGARLAPPVAWVKSPTNGKQLIHCRYIQPTIIINQNN